MDDIRNLTGMHIDILREIGNIGAGNAATALSTLLNKKLKWRCRAFKLRRLPK
ncbi:CheY-P phosphatase CheC [Geobacillus sp. BCO2]|nr:CheY-P phosphatase CheC [Geobacillus sp. BCO2]